MYISLETEHNRLIQDIYMGNGYGEELLSITPQVNPGQNMRIEYARCVVPSASARFLNLPLLSAIVQTEVWFEARISI